MKPKMNAEDVALIADVAGVPVHTVAIIVALAEKRLEEKTAAQGADTPATKEAEK